MRANIASIALLYAAALLAGQVFASKVGEPDRQRAEAHQQTDEKEVRPSGFFNFEAASRRFSREVLSNSLTHRKGLTGPGPVNDPSDPWVSTRKMRTRQLQTAGVPSQGAVSKPGGAGHALLFKDHVVVTTDLKDFPTTALTFEAWISTSDFCHAGTVMSYSKNSQAREDTQRIIDFNHFVIFDVRNLLACHDFQYIDLVPDIRNESCHAGYIATSGSSKTASLVERDGAWHHLAVTWDGNNKGLSQIYKDGLLMASSYSGRTAPLEAGGALALGGEQDCFGGCFDANQGFNGVMDEVRIWRVARSPEDILKTMRWAHGLEGHADLIAWWHFNEPDSDPGIFGAHSRAVDSSGRGNDLPLTTPPKVNTAVVGTGRDSLTVGTLEMRNSLLINKDVHAMPDKSFTVELWARGRALADSDTLQQPAGQLLSYATRQASNDGATSQGGFIDDAIRIERIMATSVKDAPGPDGWTGFGATPGSVALHVNSLEGSDDDARQAVIYFDAGWTDGNWHHVAVTWDYESGMAYMYLDGQPKLPFWKTDYGLVDWRPPSIPGLTPTMTDGVDPRLAARTARNTSGSLVLGQDQDCYGGCFSPSSSFNGGLAAVRIWRTALPRDRIIRNMMKEVLSESDGASTGAGGDVAAAYAFTAAHMDTPVPGQPTIRNAVDMSGNQNHLTLRGTAPQYMYSTAPLSTNDGAALSPPTPGAGGYSLALTDKQVLLLPGFRAFPSTAITVEFWMWSTDSCRPGVPFSYAAPDAQYGKNDNAFLLFNYNSWGVSVLEDEGSWGDHTSGVSATDGSWHHVAVTWDSATGRVKLYDNGRPVWQAIRARGKSIPSGGTLVIGREQDCLGGCFDSAPGATGRVTSELEYGAQDFFGVIEEMRVWGVVRSAEQIRAGMDADDGRGPGGFESPGVNPREPGLVAYWKFDEGAGYQVKDATGHGHDLLITQPPAWQVTRWLSSCGNARVEGAEECDDGDLSDGDGCSASCKIEPGFTCFGNPSVCWRNPQGGDPSGPAGGGPGGPGPVPGPPGEAPGPAPRPGPNPVIPPAPAPSSSGGDDSASGGSGSTHSDSAAGGPAAGNASGSSGKKRSVMGWVFGMLGGVCLVGVALLGFIKRRELSESLPEVPHAVYSRLPASLRRALLHSDYHPLVVNPEEANAVDAGFLHASPPRPYASPAVQSGVAYGRGHAGSRTPMNGNISHMQSPEAYQVLPEFNGSPARIPDTPVSRTTSSTPARTAGTPGRTAGFSPRPSGDLSPASPATTAAGGPGQTHGSPYAATDGLTFPGGYQTGYSAPPLTLEPAAHDSAPLDNFTLN